MCRPGTKHPPLSLNCLSLTGDTRIFQVQPWASLVRRFQPRCQISLNLPGSAERWIGGLCFLAERYQQPRGSTDLQIFSSGLKSMGYSRRTSPTEVSHCPWTGHFSELWVCPGEGYVGQETEHPNSCAFYPRDEAFTHHPSTSRGVLATPPPAERSRGCQH